MPVNLRNGTFRDVMTSRGGRNSEMSFSGNFTIKILAIDPSWPKPPEFYEYDRYVDRVFIGNHFGFQYQLTFGMELKGSAIPPNVGLWEWKFVCDVDIVYPDGYVKSGQIVLGSELVNPAVYNYKDVSFPVTFNSSTIFNSVQYVNTIETGISPPITQLRLFEQIPASVLVQQPASVTVTGLTGGTVEELTHYFNTAQNTDYEFTIDTKLHSKGATANIQTLNLSPLTINELALPDYNYLHLIDSNNYYHQTSAVDTKIQGADDINGDPVYRFLEAQTLVTLERNFDVETKINAWSDSYPDDLTIRAQTSGAGGTIDLYTASLGTLNFSKSWKNYSFTSNINGAINTLNYNNLPAENAYFQLSIDSTSMIANGDSPATRLPFRGWWENGADIYHEKNYILPGSGNTRDYVPGQREFLSSYRYMNVTASNATTQPIQSKLILTTSASNIIGTGNTVILEKDLTFNPGTETKTVDLCFAGIAHTNFPDIQNQDNPYPRPYSTTDAAGRLINQDMYGVSSICKIETTGNLSVSEYKLTRSDNTAKATLISGIGQNPNSPSANGLWVRLSNQNPLQNVRRFFEQDVNGRNEEEYDVIFTSTGGPDPYLRLNTFDLCDNIQNRQGYQGGYVHQGWNAIATGPTTGDLVGTNLGWFQPGEAYCTWLNGFGLQCISGDRRYSILRDLSQESGDRDIYAQQVFDRLNARYPPDYFDAFQVESPGYPNLKLIAFSCLRSAAHGLVQEQLFNEVVTLQSTTGVNWGQGTTDIVGNYQTGLSYGHPTSAAQINYNSSLVTIPLLSHAKRFRGAFYYLPVPPSLIVLSADISGFYQKCIGTIESGVVKLIFTPTPNFSTFDVLTTNITGMSNVAIAWLHPTNSNQMKLVTQRTSDSAILIYELDNFVNGVASMGTVIGNGTTPAIAINGIGTQIIFWRTSGSNIQRIILDSAGNITTAASNVVTGNVANLGIGCFWDNDRVFLVYNHTTNGLTVVRSDDYGQTFS